MSVTTNKFAKCFNDTCALKAKISKHFDEFRIGLERIS